MITTINFDLITANEPVGIEVRADSQHPILVVVSGYETEFETQLFNASGKRLAATRIRYARMAPHYQLIEASEDSDIFNIEVIPIYTTVNSRLNIKIYNLPNLNSKDSQLAQAYRLYAGATESTENESIEFWQARIEKIRQAARVLESTGRERDWLWAETLISFFTYYPVFNNNVAISESRVLYEQSLAMGYPDIALMNLHTEGQALIERDQGDSPKTAQEKLLLAQERFKLAEVLATELKLGYERSWAINNRGIGYYYLAQYDAAITQYDQALGMASSLDDSFWFSLVVSNLALAKEKKGDYVGALLTLQGATRYYRELGSLPNLIQNLTEEGRLHRRLYQFPEAIEALTEALSGAKETRDMEAEGRIGFWLSKAYFSMGYHTRALDLISESIGNMEATNNGFGLWEAHQLAANIARFNHEFGDMQFHRQRQSEYLGSEVSQANYYYDRGLDSVALSEGQQDKAFEFFSEAYRRNLELDNLNLLRLSHLRMCSLVPLIARTEVCSLETLRIEYEALLENAIPGHVVEGMQVWSGILARYGESDETLAVMEDLITKIRFYRSNLPGVLGAWYWESRADIFQAYLDLAIKADIQSGDGTGSLLALDRLRNVELSSAISDWDELPLRDGNDSSMQLRNLVVRRENLKDTAAIKAVERSIDRLLLKHQKGSSNVYTLGRNWITEVRANLAQDSALLSYHFSPTGSWAWLLDQKGVSLYKISDSDEVVNHINETREKIRVVGYSNLDQDLEALGHALIESISLELPTKVYLLPSGVLNGFAFDALRVNERYLIQDHMVVNLMSLAGLNSVITGGEAVGTIKRVFLAGNPLLEGGNLPDLSASKLELQAIMDVVGDAEIFQAVGKGLTLAAFQGSEFSGADLVHIASHAQIDMEYPELSRLSLSSVGSSETFLTPHDLEALQLSAQLVVLSACETVGINRFRYDANLGFVSTLLRAGATSIIATLWPVSNKTSLAITSEFYAALFNGANAAIALREAKLRYINASGNGGVDEWGVFQIYWK